MKVVVERFLFKDDCTVGHLYINGELKGFTMEDAYRTIKIKGITCIPYGTYKVSHRYSPHFSPQCGHEMLWVKDVPGFDYILIHWGNTNKDTEGCLLVGDKLGVLNGTTAILDSRKCFDKIHPIIFDAVMKNEEVTIEYTHKV